MPPARIPAGEPDGPPETRPMADAAAATPETETADYDIKVEDAGPARKRLSITIAAADVDRKVGESIGALAASVQMPGFRKGHAPTKLIERRFGGDVRNEAKNQLVADAYSAALEQHDLRPVTEPEPVGDFESLEVEDGKPLSFVVEVEVVPDMDLPELDGFELKKPVLEVEDDHVENEMTRQQTQLGTIVDVEEGFAEGDRILGPGTVAKEGDDEPFFTHDNVDVIVPGDDDGGRGAVLGLLIDGLADMLKGRKVGDVLEIDTVGPDSHELEHIRGEKLHIRIEIAKGQRIEPADLDTVVAHYGLADEATLREQVKIALESRLAAEQQHAMREQVYEQLADKTDFELPEKMTENQASRVLERQRLELLYRGGMTTDEVEQRVAEMRSDAEAVTRRRLKLSFLMHRLADDLGVTVTEQEVNARIVDLARSRNMRPEKLRQDLIESRAIGEVGTQIRDHKVADRIIEKAKIEDVAADAWNAEVEQRREERAKAAKG